MKQLTFSDIKYGGRTKIAIREESLDTMNEIIPLEEWIALIQPHNFNGKQSRPSIGIDKMLRMYML